MLEHFVKDLESVEEKYRDLYEEAEGGFEVKVKGVAEMKRAKDREKEKSHKLEAEAREVREKLAELQADIDAEKEKAARSSGDTEALDKSWQEKLAAREAELAGQIDSLNGSLETLLVKNTAQSLASELAVSGSADVLLPHIQKRLAVDVRDGERVAVVLGPDGKPSASTVDDLKAEITGNKAFAPLLAGSKATGSGASGAISGGAAQTKGDPGGSREERKAYFQAKMEQAG